MLEALESVTLSPWIARSRHWAQGEGGKHRGCVEAGHWSFNWLNDCIQGVRLRASHPAGGGPQRATVL